MNCSDAVSKYFSVAKKNTTKSQSIMWYEKKNNTNGLGLYVTLDYFKFFNDYLTCEQFMVFLASRLFGIEGSLNFFDNDSFPIKADFFYIFGMQVYNEWTLLKFISVQKDIYSKLINEPVNLSLVRMGLKREYKSLRSIVERYGFQLINRLTIVGDGWGVDYELCESCNNGDIPFDMLYTSSVVLIDHAGVQMTCIKYGKGVYVTDDYKYGYRVLYSKYKACEGCIKKEVKYINVIPEEILSEHVNLGDLGQLKEEVKEVIVQVENNDVNIESNYATLTEKIYDLYADVGRDPGGIFELSQYHNDDISSDNEDKDSQGVSDITKDMKHSVRDYLKGVNNYHVSKDFPLFFEDERLTRYVRRDLDIFLDKNHSMLMGVYSTCNFILNAMNSNLDKFVAFRQTGCLSEYDFLKYNIKYPKALLLFSNNNIFIEKSIIKYIKVVIKWLSDRMVRMRFNGSQLVWEVDRKSLDQCKLDEYVKRYCYEKKFCNYINSDPFMYDLANKKKKRICCVTGVLTDSYYVYKSNSDLVFDKKYADACLSKDGYFIYNFVLKITKDNLIFDPNSTILNIDKMDEKGHKKHAHWFENDDECGSYVEGWDAYKSSN